MAEICATETMWATMACDLNNEVLTQVNIKVISYKEMYDELMNCIRESTDPRIADCDHDFGEALAMSICDEDLWTLHYEDTKYLLFKLWYDSVTLRMGVKPQVKIFSDKMPKRMPNHWIFIYQPAKDSMEDSIEDSIEYMHPDTTPEVYYDNFWANRTSERRTKRVQRLSYSHSGQTSVCFH